MSSRNILSNLNSSQRAAVSSSAHTLSILAGPGSGKTHTLTARTAYLLKELGLQPWNVIVATFTKKAATEMKERIGKLIGEEMASKLVLGTFHSISNRYLARYGHLINIQKGFGIADSSDSLAIVKRIIKRHKLTIEPPAARNRISSRKAKGGKEVAGKRTHQSAEKALEIQEFETCYTEYEEALKRSNLLDYDDLLLRCVDLLRDFPSCVSNVEAVLIDEFQDTNTVQFDLMRLFAAQQKRVTIVGDPDQSIYGWRSAETKNFKRMLVQYPETITIPLEENYRSSGAILLSALEVIQQDEGRINKPLMPTHVVGTRPVLRKLSSAHNEAQWIITEIKRVVALTGNLMTFEDIAILLRSASLSRHIESALGKTGIPYRMIGGLKFFDRAEVKVILDYLRVINLPDNNDALSRVINIPPRRVGDETVKKLLEEADRAGVTLWKLILDNVQGIKNAKTKLHKQTEQGLSSFVNIILTSRKKMSDPDGSLPSIRDLIDYVMTKISFEDYLERNYSEDCESRLANVQELINQASDFTDLMANGDEDNEALPEVEGLSQNSLSDPLSRFLVNIALASAIDASEAKGSPKLEVTISTIHAAKGLEWPVVFIPGAYQGSIPHSRADDDNEERRLLYVAMTRAKALLYMSYPYKNSQREQTTLSPFLSPTSLKSHLDDKGPSFPFSVTQSIAQILRRVAPCVDFEAAAASLESLEDDLFVIEEEETEENISKWQERDGEPHYTQGQRPPKRQRVELNKADGTAQQTWRPDYSTTMTQSASFSTASATLGSGFVSAGSHLKVLNVQYGNQSSDVAGSTTAISDFRSNLENKKASSKSFKSRTTQRSEGQGNLMSFFSKPVKASSQVVKPQHLSVASRSNFPVRHEKLETFQPAKLRQSHSAPSVSEYGVHPSLGDHRLGSGQLSLPPRQPYEDGIKKKAYVFLSSSPQGYDALIRDAEEPTPLQLNEPDTNPETLPAASIMSQPAKTMHTTSMAKLSAVVPRKTLGVRRSMNGWAHRKSQAFTPPTVQRPP